MGSEERDQILTSEEVKQEMHITSNNSSKDCKKQIRQIYRGRERGKGRERERDWEGGGRGGEGGGGWGGGGLGQQTRKT